MKSTGNRKEIIGFSHFGAYLGATYFSYGGKIKTDKIT